MDRTEELEALAADLQGFDAVEDAWIAKSFTDRLLVVESSRTRLPEGIRGRIESHDLRGSNAVYGDEDEEESFAGDVADGTRHRFVDVRTRGQHQSYVVE